MKVRTLDSHSARENWQDMLDEVHTGTIDIVITYYGKPITAMIRYEDYVALQGELQKLRGILNETFQTMFASEVVLRREWDTAEEDKAWADL
jgi:prevent-host-death family protein